MRASNKQITLVSEAELSALYDQPDFDSDQRLEYLNMTVEEQGLMRKRSNLVAQVHFALQLGYFKAKHLFFRFKWNEVEEDTAFIMQEYFPEQTFEPISITNHEHYAQYNIISKNLGYRLWSKDFEGLVHDQAEQIIRRDISPQFILMELLAFLREQKIIRPGYTTLQTIVTHVLNIERQRLGSIILEALGEADKLTLNELLVEEDTLSVTARFHKNIGPQSEHKFGPN